jgi:hypothetical protein
MRNSEEKFSRPRENSLASSRMWRETHMPSKESPGNLKLQARPQKYLLTKGEMKMMERMEHARPIREKQVKSLLAALKRGAHFDAPLVVNETIKDGERNMRVLDGNHRLEAVKLYLKEHPESSIQVLLLIYDNLTEEEERAVFIRHNLTIHVTLSDRVEVTQDDFPIYKMMRRNFPTSVTTCGPKAGQQGLKFINLITAYATRLNTGPSSGRANEVLNRAKLYGKQDYETMSAFVEDFVAAFAQPARENRFSTKPGLVALFRVWSANLETLGRGEICKRWSTRVIDDANVRNWIMARGLGNVREIQNAIVSAMNRGRNRPLALTPDETRLRSTPTDTLVRVEKPSASSESEATKA